MSNTATQLHTGSFLMPSIDDATVGDAVHPGILSCDPDASLTEIARLMASHHVHCITVIGISHDVPGEEFVWGIITDRDLVASGLQDGAEPTARTLAKHPIITVSPTMPLRDAGRLMLGRGVSHLVVVDPDTQRPTGIVSTLDVVGVLAWGEA